MANRTSIADHSLTTDSDGKVVYFVTSHKSRRVKIGWTSRLKSRLSSIQTGNPTPIKLLHTMPGGAELEARLHRQFAADRTQGEWFRFSDAIRDFVFHNGGPWSPPAGSFTAKSKDDDGDLRAAMVASQAAYPRRIV